MKIRADIKQGSPEWFLLRRGKLTASRAATILTPKTMKLSSQHHAMMCRLIAERAMPQVVTDWEVQDYLRNNRNRATDYGTKLEDDARLSYVLRHDVDVEQVGFIEHDDLPVGCSPDGLIYQDGTGTLVGGVELKVPDPHTHIGYMLDPESLVMDYRPQIHLALLVSGAAWWDIVSYQYGWPEVERRVTPDDFTQALGIAVREFCEKYETAWSQLAPQRAEALAGIEQPVVF